MSNATLKTLATIIMASCLVLSSLKSAKAQEVSVVQSVDSEIESSIGEESPRTEEHDDPALRIVSETLFGIGTLALPTLIGVGLGELADAHTRSTCTPSGWFSCWELGKVAFGGLGAAVGTGLMPLGVTLGGRVAGGRGHAGGAYLGFLAGGAVSVGAVGLASLSNDGIAIAWTALLTAPLALAGSIIGYEITDHNARLPLNLQPSISASANSFNVSVSGEF